MTTVSTVLSSFRQNVPAARSTEKYRERVYRVLDRQLGQKDVSEARLIDLLDWLNGIPTWSPGMRRLAVSATNAAFNWAVRVGLIQHNPFSGAEMPTVEPGRAWTEAEYASALENAQGVFFIEFRSFMRFMRSTGARPGEVSALTWPMLQGNKFVLEQHKTRKKTKKPRTIPLSSEAQGVVKYQPKDRELVFASKGGAVWDRSKLSVKMAQLRERSGLAEDCVLHGIRHLFATDFIKRGGNISVLSKILGHASIQTTISSYIHLADDDVDMMLNAMDGLRAAAPGPA